jgi:hypothetical protein
MQCKARNNITPNDAFDSLFSSTIDYFFVACAFPSCTIKIYKKVPISSRCTLHPLLRSVERAIETPHVMCVDSDIFKQHNLEFQILHGRGGIVQSEGLYSSQKNVYLLQLTYA